MTDDGVNKPALRFIRKPKLLSSGLHYGRNFLVMNMTNIRKQMMFNLKIQSTNIPREKCTVIRKVCRGMQLVNSPAIIHFSVVVWHRKFCAIDDVSRLKNDRKNESCNVMHRHKSDQPLPPSDVQY